MSCRIMVLFLSVFVFCACSQESKVKSAIKDQVRQKVIADIDRSLKGSEKSKVWSEFKELVTKNILVEVSEVQVSGSEAQGVVNVTRLEEKTTGGLVLLLLFAASELDKKGMGLEDAWAELRKKDHRVPAMSDYPKESKEYRFTAFKKDSWTLKEMKEVSVKMSDKKVQKKNN